jgi:cell shape-determining protein MreC
VSASVVVEQVIGVSSRCSSIILASEDYPKIAVDVTAATIIHLLDNSGTKSSNATVSIQYCPVVRDC